MGVISIAVPAIERWYFTEIVRGAEQQALAKGHGPRIHRVALAEESTAVATAAIQADFRDQDSIGAVAAGFRYRADAQTVGTSWARPLVLVGGSALGFPTVMIDDLTASRTATEHLRGLGHTRIAHFTTSTEHQAGHLIIRRRAKGYRLAMEAGGLEPVVVEHELDQTAAYEAARRVLTSPSRPTAVFGVTDDIAIGVLEAARELGLQPGQDLSVVGFNDQPEALAEDLTTTRIRPAEMGAAAVDMLLSGLTPGLDPSRSHLHPSTLVTRGSTGRARAATGRSPMLR
ncbi:LacI family DNA-binding transcriptional regulator [Amnibacterium setariae]|uniref:LacI family transcriptional regulator n=1 Tax=Amnibacterium setariae TaxID=2306585 RepID=A0A3A1U7R4_9MICO|nr:substrate-binding domain-containing protein [Amnibacterium setariae]RIX31088.1 LacI family transcriptional regulator [Amnibacterium setariae]